MMTINAPLLRPASPADAVALSELVNMAGEGLPLQLWGKMAAAGETAWDVGRQRAARQSGGFSYTNAVMIGTHSRPTAGSLIGYPIAHDIEPIPDDIPPLFRPLQELENSVPGSWYVNILAVYPDCRGLGLGTELLGHADDIGRSLGVETMSVIVSDANRGARSLYERCGYKERDRRPLEKEDWENPGENWILMTKPL